MRTFGCLQGLGRPGTALLIVVPVSLSMAQTPPPSPAGAAPQAASRPDTLQMAWGSRPLPDSAWLADEREHFTSLAPGRYAYVVAPVTSMGLGVDQVTRLIVQARLAALLAERGAAVVNPFVTQRALGEGLRVIDAAALQSFARKAGAAGIVTVDLTHDGAGTLRLAVQTGDGGARSPAGVVLIERAVPVAGALHPTEALRTTLVDVANQLVGPAKTKVSAARREAPAPESPRRALAIDLAQVSRTAQQLQLLATLTPAQPERARVRLAVQSLLAAERLPAGDPLRPFLIARAWTQLGDRPLALESLGASKTPEAVAQREFIDGNLPELRAALAGVTRAEARALLELDLRELQSIYGEREKGEPTPTLRAQLDGKSAWAALYQRRIDDADPWRAGPPVLAKALLDRDLPLAGASLEDQVAARRAAGLRMDDAFAVKAALAHARRVRAENALVKSCLAAALPCVAGAYVDLLEAIALSDAVRSVRLRSQLQGLHADAVALADSYKPELAGFAPLLAVAIAAQRELQHKDAPAVAALEPLAMTVLWLEQGWTRTANEVSGSGIADPRLPIFLFNAYGEDLPTALEAHTNRLPRTLPAPKRLIDAATYAQFERVVQLAFMGGPEAGRAAEQALNRRFHGHPQRQRILARLAGETEDSLARLEAALKEGPDRFGTYANLALYHLDQGNYTAALEVLRRFPGFKSSRGYNPVEVGNYAYLAASQFFWRGRLDEAEELFKVSLQLRTGSEAMMASEQRLATLKGDYVTALASAQQRVSRYEDPFAKRDYLSWLFALGESEQAWAAFARFERDPDAMEAWAGADVGLRIGARPWSATREWLLAEPQRPAASNGVPYALRLAIMQNAVDRTPAEDFVDTLRALAGPPVIAVLPDMSTGQVHKIEGRTYGPASAFRRGGGQILRTTPQPLESPFVLFGDAYARLRRGDVVGALAKFDDMARLYPIEGAGASFDGYALPYFAWASAKVKDPMSLERFLTSTPPADRSQHFDHALALAFFAGQRGDHEAALRHLDRAFHRRPFTLARPIPTEYQWAEACEWLYLETREPRYIGAALKWAKAFQRVHPMVAWPYALEAQYGTNESDRVRALGIAQYLDPQSERIASLDAALKERAKAVFAAGNPFGRRGAKPPRQS